MTESRAAAVADERGVSGHLVLPAEPGQLATIRAQVYRWLAPLDLPGDTEHDLVLAVNEAAANAIEHAYPPGADGRVELSFWLAGDDLYVAVTDRGRWREPPPGPRDRGFGLPLMRRLAAAVAIEHDVRGTRVVLQHPVVGSSGDPGGACAGMPEPASADGAGRR